MHFPVYNAGEQGWHVHNVQHQIRNSDLETRQNLTNMQSIV